mgnify:CR=1 FL=1
MNSNYSAQKKNFATVLLHNLWKYLLLAASIVATVKIIFFGFDIDEQYAVSMAYRLVQGDRMFLEMWEPHQTSAFFSAAFLWLYMQLFHTLKYSVLFLRIVGVVTQLLISILTYRTFRKFVTENTAFVIAVFLLQYHSQEQYRSRFFQYASVVQYASVSLPPVLFSCGEQ